MIKKICLVGFSLFLFAKGEARESELLMRYRAMALEYSHDLKAAEKNIVTSMELENAAKADRKPKLAADADFRYVGNPTALSLDLPMLGQPLGFEGKNISYGASLTLMQPLYTGGRVLETIRKASHQHDLAVNRKDAVRAALCYQTEVQYWNTVARYELVEIASDYRRAVAVLVDNIREKVEAGLAEPQDLLMAEVKLNEASYRLLQTQSDYETGIMALNSLIGLDLTAPTVVDSNIPGLIVNDSLYACDGSDRPELKMADDQVKIAKSQLRITDSKYKPQLYLGANGSYSSPGYDFNSDPDPNYAVYAKLSVPLFEWGKRKDEKRASEQQIGVAYDHLNKVRDEVALQIGNARTSLFMAQEQVKLSENSLEKAMENEYKATERYDEGKVSILEVIEAQTYRQTSQVNYTRARMAVQTYYAELKRALNCFDCE